MNWTTKDGTQIPIKDLADMHLTKIIGMYMNIAKRLRKSYGDFQLMDPKTDLELLHMSNPHQTDVLNALFEEHALRNK